MAARQIEDFPELAEELQPLAEEVPAPRAGRFSKRTVVLGVGLAVAAAAAYTLAPGQGEPHLTVADVAAKQGKFKGFFKKGFKKMADRKKWGTGPLALEGDMGKFISENSLPEEATLKRGLGASLGSSASALFDHVTDKSGVGKELNEKELGSYKHRFVSAMVNMAGSNKGPTADYVERAKTHMDLTKPVMSESLAAVKNNRQKSFTVKMQDWMLEESVDSFNSRLIKVPYQPPSDATKVFKKRVPSMGLKSGTLPKNFESAKFWPKCAATIQNPHNQGRCGSCWVFGAMGALDSRICIATDGAFDHKNDALSRGMGASCASDWDGCQGGWPHLVYDYMEKSGGIASSNCVPYFGGENFADHWNNAMGAPACPTACDSRYSRSMAQDMFNPIGITSYRLVDAPDDQGIHDLKEAIMNEGPVSYALYANHAFMGYNGGVFDEECGHQANHAVQAIGFGRTLDGKDFIQSLNSWGTHWGTDGRFNVAPCVVWHYVIPGSITNTKAGDYPLPIPDLN